MKENRSAAAQAARISNYHPASAHSYFLHKMLQNELENQQQKLIIDHRTKRAEWF